MKEGLLVFLMEGGTVGWANLLLLHLGSIVNSQWLTDQNLKVSIILDHHYNQPCIVFQCSRLSTSDHPCALIWKVLTKTYREFIHFWIYLTRWLVSHSCTYTYISIYICVNVYLYLYLGVEDLKEPQWIRTYLYVWNRQKCF